MDAHPWTGRFLDGRTAAARRVSISPVAEGLIITQGDGTSVQWAYGDIQRTQGAYEGEHIRLEYGTDPPAALVITDQRFLTVLRGRAPQLVSVIHDPRKRRLRLTLTFLAAVLAIAATGVIYRWGIPGLALVATPYVPVAWEQQLGEEVVAHLAPEKARCSDPYRKQILESLLGKLSATVPNNPYRTIHVHIVDEPIVNAFAAPGGSVVVFRGLLEKTETPEQLAGVLAHELQHIYKRHSTRMILEQTSTSLLIAAVSGDLTGAAAIALDTAQTLGALRYSREHETEADTEGLRMMIAAGMNPSGMIEFFTIMGKGDHGDTSVWRYISTHPTHEDRVQVLTSIAGSAIGGGQPLLPGLDWKSIRNVCPSRKRPSSESGPSTPEPVGAPQS